MRVLLILFLMSFFSLAKAQKPEIHCKHFFYGYPFGTPKTNDLIIRDSYAMSNNDETKFADWVAYRLDTFTVKGSKRKRKWRADPWLDDSETLEPSDYKNANATLKTDRGHQAPLGSLDAYSTYYETNYLSNITPQKSILNRGTWVYLENMIRKKVAIFNEVYVVTGPLYERKMDKLPSADEPHQVPSGYWKIVFLEKGNEICTAAFIFDQEATTEFRLNDAYVSIRAIEKRAKLDFLWLLEDKLERNLEGKIMKFSDWE